MHLHFVVLLRMCSFLVLCSILNKLLLKGVHLLQKSVFQVVFSLWEIVHFLAVL